MKTLVLIATVLQVTAASAANFQQLELRQGNGSNDVVRFVGLNTVMVEETRQVGGPGGISNEGVVPYPTVCRVRQWGQVISRSSRSLKYAPAFAHLTEISTTSSSPDCVRYIEAFNKLAHEGEISFTIDLQDFSEVEKQ